MRIFTLPNIISTSRLLTGPVVIACLGTGWNPLSTWFGDYRITALVICVYAWLSDYIDGYASKLPGQRSDLGAKLDPIADVVSLSCFPVGLFCYYGLTIYTMLVYGLPSVITLVYAVRVTTMRWRGQILESSWDAKWKTGWLFFSATLLLSSIVIEGSLWIWATEIPGVYIGWRTTLHTSTVLSNYRRRAEHAI